MNTAVSIKDTTIFLVAIKNIENNVNLLIIVSFSNCSVLLLISIIKYLLPRLSINKATPAKYLLPFILFRFLRKSVFIYL